MRVLVLQVGIALCFSAATASANPLMPSGGSQLMQGTPLVDVHHKPGHGGGPPWKRKNHSQDDWRAGHHYERDFSSTYVEERRTPCRTTYRSYFDDYTGEYVRRSVRVCG